MKNTKPQAVIFSYVAKVNTGHERFEGTVRTQFSPTKFVTTSMQMVKAFVRGLMNVSGDWKVSLTVDDQTTEFVCEVNVLKNGVILRVDHEA